MDRIFYDSRIQRNYFKDDDMYKFIKNKHTTSDGKEYEIVDRVDINGEILVVDSTWDHDKFIIECKLENINRLIKDNNFPNTIGFSMNSEENSFPEYISNVWLEKEQKKFVIKFYLYFQHKYWNVMWSLSLFEQTFGEVFKKNILISNYSAEIELNNDKDGEDFGGEIRFYCDNLTLPNKQIKEFSDVIKDIYEKTDTTLHNDNLGVYSMKIPVDSKIKTALKQYLVFFPEFVERAKGEKIDFEVTSEDDTLNIQVSKNANLDLIDKYLKEYIGFIKKSINSLSPQIKNSSLVDMEKELLIIELNSQINHFKTTIQIKEVEIKYLEKDVDRLTGLLTESIKSNTKNQIAISVDSNSSSSATSDTVLNFNIKNELNLLQKELVGLKEQINSTNNEFKYEIDKIDSELLKVDNDKIEDIKNNKHVFQRLRRLLEILNDSNSEVNKTINLTKEGIKKVQKLAKIYNKFAQWLLLPQVPDVFL